MTITIGSRALGTRLKSADQGQRIVGHSGNQGQSQWREEKEGVYITWAATGALSKAEQTQSWWEWTMTISRWEAWRLIQALVQSRWWQSLAQRQASRELRGTGGGHRAPVQRQVKGSHSHAFKKEGSRDILQRSLISDKLNLRCQWNMEVKAFSRKTCTIRAYRCDGRWALACKSVHMHTCVCKENGVGEEL